jgi:spore germination protein PC
MNMYEWNNYIYELQQIAYRQGEQISVLEAKVDQLERQLQENKNSSIDKIEYHFDQLKIERLDGTLHIGLSPNELANIDDLSIPKPKIHKHATQNLTTQKLTPALNQFVNNQGPDMIRSLSEKYNLPIDRKLEGDVIHDILGQIPGRISFYEKEAREKHQITNQQQLENFVSDHIKKEIYHSLERFVEKTKDQKGEAE